MQQCALIYLYDVLMSVFNWSYIAYQLQKQLSPELQSEWISKDVLQWSEKKIEGFMRSSQSTLVLINILVEVSCFKNLCHNKILWSAACLQQFVSQCNSLYKRILQSYAFSECVSRYRRILQLSLYAFSECDSRNGMNSDWKSSWLRQWMNVWQIIDFHSPLRT